MRRPQRRTLPQYSLAARPLAALVAACLLLVGGCRPAADNAQQSSGDAPSADIPQDVTPEEVAERMLAKYRTAQSYADSARYVQHYVVRGEGVRRERPFFELSVALERPNRMRLALQESLRPGQTGQSYTVASNGEQLRVFVAALADQLLVAPAPEAIRPDNFLPDPLLRDTLASRSLGDVFPQLAMLLNDSDDELVFPQDSPPEFLPSRDLDGRACYRLASRSPAGQRVLWIDQQDAVLRRMELPIDSQQEELDPNGQYMEHSVSIDLLDPTFDAQIDGASFELEAPEGATLVTKLTPPTPPGPHSLIGQTIGDVAFYDAEGERHGLDEYADRVVVLDFWQIDCPPCRTQAARLEALHGELVAASPEVAEKLTVIGVNVDRDDVPAARIESTWASWGSSTPWLADRKRESRDAVRIRETPTLVVLDGRLRVHHWSTGLLDAAALRTLLDDLLAGKDVAGAERAAHEARVAEHRRAVEANRWEPNE